MWNGPLPRGERLAALDRRRRVLGADLRVGLDGAHPRMRLDRADLLVGLDRAQIPMVLVMMVAHLDAALAHISLLHISLGLRRRGNQGHRRLALSRLAGGSRERRR